MSRPCCHFRPWVNGSFRHTCAVLWWFPVELEIPVFDERVAS